MQKHWLYYFNALKLNSSTEEIESRAPSTSQELYYNFTDPFGSVELIFRIFNLEFSLKC